MTVCPAVVRHRPEIQGAAEEGKSVVEIGAKEKKTAEEICELWKLLDGNAKRLADAKTKAKREAARS